LDYGSASAETGVAYLGMLGIDSLLGIVSAIEKLTDIAVEGDMAAEGSSLRQQSPGVLHDRDPVERATCEAMISLCWRTVLSALSQLLARTSGEALVVQLLKVSG